MANIYLLKSIDLSKIHIESFLDGIGVSVEDMEAKEGFLVLVVNGNDGRDHELVIKAKDDRLVITTAKR